MVGYKVETRLIPALRNARKIMVKITYLHHSGFAVELDRVVLLFDVISEVPEEVLGTGKPMIFVNAMVITTTTIRRFQAKRTRGSDPATSFRTISSFRADDITMIKPDERLVVRLSSKNELISGPSDPRTAGSR